MSLMYLFYVILCIVLFCFIVFLCQPERGVDKNQASSKKKFKDLEEEASSYKSQFFMLWFLLSFFFHCFYHFCYHALLFILPETVTLSTMYTLFKYNRKLLFKKFIEIKFYIIYHTNLSIQVAFSDTKT